VAVRGGAGADAIIGGTVNAAGVITAAGLDTADYTSSVDGVTIDLSTTISLTLPLQGLNLQFTNASQGFGGDAQGDYLQDIVHLTGSNTGADTLTGNALANTLNGQAAAGLGVPSVPSGRETKGTPMRSRPIQP